MIFQPHKFQKLIYGEHLGGTYKLGFHMCFREKVAKHYDFPEPYLQLVYPDLATCLAMPGYARLCAPGGWDLRYTLTAPRFK